MASSTQTVVEEALVEVQPITLNSGPNHGNQERIAQEGLVGASPVDRPVTGEERRDLFERDGQRSSWPDMINKATEINLNIGGLQANFRIGVVILLVLVLCIVSIARWPTSSSPTGSQSSDAPTLELLHLSPVNVSTAEDTKNPHTPVSLENKNSTVVDSSKTQSAQAMSTIFSAIADLSYGEVSQVLEKAIQDLRYPTDQNETIEELQALNRELILKAHQQAVEETVQTLKKKVIHLIAWVSVAAAIADPILLVFFVSIRALLRLYWYRGFEVQEDEPDDRPSRLHTVRHELRRAETLEPLYSTSSTIPRRRYSVSPEPRHPESPWQRYTVRYAFGGSISPPFLVRILSQSIYLGSATYYLCKEQRTAGDTTIIAGCGMSLLLSALSRTSAATGLGQILRKILRKLYGLYDRLDEFFARGVSRLPYMMDFYYPTGGPEPPRHLTT